MHVRSIDTIKLNIFTERSSRRREFKSDSIIIDNTFEGKVAPNDVSIHSHCAYTQTDDSDSLAQN